MPSAAATGCLQCCCRQRLVRKLSQVLLCWSSASGRVMFQWHAHCGLLCRRSWYFGHFVAATLFLNLYSNNSVASVACSEELLYAQAQEKPRENVCVDGRRISPTMSSMVPTSGCFEDNFFDNFTQLLQNIIGHLPLDSRPKAYLLCEEPEACAFGEALQTKLASVNVPVNLINKAEFESHWSSVCVPREELRESEKTRDVLDLVSHVQDISQTSGAVLVPILSGPFIRSEHCASMLRAASSASMPILPLLWDEQSYSEVCDAGAGRHLAHLKSILNRSPEHHIVL